MSSIKFNILANYVSQVYLIVIGIVVLPMYIKYMGAEAYGLVGFFTMMQGIFNILDFGLTPTLSRQTTRYHAGVITSLAYRQIFRALSSIFYSIAVIAGIGLFLVNDFIAQKWLNIEKLNPQDIYYCLYIMVVCVILRWLIGLYKGVITGFEQIVWLSITNTIIATLRFLGVLGYMYYYGFTIINFFNVQLAVALLEFAVFFIKNNQLLPKLNPDICIGWSIAPIKPLLGFSLSIAFSSIVWVLTTQLDKLILSGIINLSEYGYFTLAVLIAGGILQISTPISGVLMPRMVFLHSEQKFEKMRQLYLKATQFVTIVIVTAGLVLTFLARPVLHVWSNDMTIVEHTCRILQLYALGNVFLVLGAFPYYLQYAKGVMKYHLIGNILSIVVLIPSIIYFALEYGAIGAGWVWLITQLVFLIGWVSFVHQKIEPSIMWQWYKVFLPSMIAVIVFLTIVNNMLEFNQGRWIDLLKIILVSGCSVGVALVFSPMFREYILDLRKRDDHHV